MQRNLGLSVSFGELTQLYIWQNKDMIINPDYVAKQILIYTAYFQVMFVVKQKVIKL